MRMRRTLITLSVGLLSFAVGYHVGTAAPAPSAAVEAPKAAAAPAVTLPNQSGSLKFAVLGDFGTGERPEYELAAQMAGLLAGFKLELVVLVGDNLYGAERPQD